MGSRNCLIGKGEDVDKKMKAFIEFGKGDIITKKQAVDFFVLSLLFIGPFGFIGEKKISIFIISVLLLVISVSMLLSVWKNEKSEFFSFGYKGMQALILMISLAMDGCRLLILILDKGVGLLIISLIILYMIILLSYMGIIKKLINQGAYLEGGKANTANIRIMATLFGVFGISIATIFSSGMDNNSVIIIIALCCFMVSILSLLGIPNLYKYIMLRKEKQGILPE